MSSGFYPKWYAVFVATGDEDNVKKRLEYRFSGDIRFCVPKRKLRERKNGQWRNVLRPLFPGYLLINGAIDVEDYYKFKDIPGMWRILLNGNELLSIPPWELGPISRLISNGEIIEPSDIAEDGGQIRIVNGPLKGMEGHIVKLDHRKGRAKIRMNFLGEERIMDLAVNLISQV